MKQIVVGVDFSKTSLLALQYALNMARHTDSDVLMVNVQKHLDHGVPLSTDERRGPEDVVQQFESLVEKHRGDIPGQLNYAVRDGKVHDEIANQAKYSDAWLVVVGAHGLSGFEEFWMGTDSYRVVATSMCPVITLRKGYDVMRPMKKVVIPIDSTLETTQKVPFTIDLAKRFNAQVHVLSLYSAMMSGIKEKVDGSSHETMRQVELAGLELVQENAVSDNITLAAIEYAKQVDADLISIMTEQEFAPRNIFLGPYAQQMVNRSPIPVLSMHTKVLMRDQHFG